MADVVIVVDASVVYEIVAQGRRRDAALEALVGADDAVAPSIVDAEVVGIIKRDRLRGVLDDTGASIAINDLLSWPVDRFAIAPLVDRVWQLRSYVRTWDAFYVALTETLDAAVITFDQRLARVNGPRCSFITLS